MKKIKHLLQNTEFQKRLWFTIFLLILYEYGSMITLPGVDTGVLADQTKSNSLIQLLNMIGGGSLDRMSLFALGVSPFITASIIVQLMSSDVIPYLTRLKDQGLKGQVKLDRITRVMTIVLAMIQSYGMIVMLSYGQSTGGQNNLFMLSLLNDNSMGAIIRMCLTMTAGSMIAIWFGDLLTMHGLGNGVSMIICAGILMRIPTQMTSIYETLAKGHMHLLIGYLISVVIMVIAIVVLQLSEIHIPIWDPSSRIQKVNDSDSNYLPLKVNTPGVMPIIFASSIMTVPLQILQLINKPKIYGRLYQYLGFQSWPSIVIYALLVVLFSFFYAKVQIDADKVSEQLTKQNAFIPDFNPGEETKKYISRTLDHIMIFGAFGLTVVAVIPYILPMFTPLSAGTAIGGTSILIIIGVLIELKIQVKGLIYKDRYEKFRV